MWRLLLEAVRAQQPAGRGWLSSSACSITAACDLRKLSLSRVQDVKLPQLRRNGDTQQGEPNELWGELHLRSARPDAGKQWTDDGTDRDHRGLKRRAEGESRTVLCPPALTALLREHLRDFGSAPLFRGIEGRPIATITYRRAWDRARATALTAEGYRSPLARRPYDLRHACLSTWLNGEWPQRRSPNGPATAWDPAPRLRQVPRRSARDRQAPDHRRPRRNSATRHVATSSCLRQASESADVSASATTVSPLGVL